MYAHRREPAEHPVAYDLMRSLAEGSDPWAIPWPCIYEFFSVVTNPKIWKSAASSPGQAWAQLAVWIDSPSIRLLSEPDAFAAVLATFAQRARVRGPVIHDARVAAICLAHGVEKLITSDRDFALFPELATNNPFT